MCIYLGHMCIKYVQNMKFLQSSLWPGGLSTDDNNAENNRRRTIHDCVGSLAFMPNELIKLLGAFDNKVNFTLTCLDVLNIVR